MIRSLKWHRNVYNSLKCGIPVSTLSKNLRVTTETINSSYLKHFDLFNKEVGTVSLGRKSEPYFTESEMIQGFTVELHELSEWELNQYQTT